MGSSAVPSHVERVKTAVQYQQRVVAVGGNSSDLLDVAGHPGDALSADNLASGRDRDHDV